MTDEVLLAILCGMAGCIGGICVWIYQHTRTCHRGRTPEEVAAAAKQAAIEAAAKAEAAAELKRVAAEIGHQTTEGSVLERLHRYGGYLRRIMERLDMEADQELP